METKFKKVTHYVLALCANTGGDVVRLYEHYADHGKALAGLKADGPYDLFWSLYAYYEDHPSECLADFDTPQEGLDYWSSLTGLPYVGIPVVEGALKCVLPRLDLSLVARSSVLAARHGSAVCEERGGAVYLVGADTLAAYAPLCAATIGKLELDGVSDRNTLVQRIGYEFFYWLSQNIVGDKGRLPSEVEAQVLLDRLVIGLLNEKGV